MATIHGVGLANGCGFSCKRITTRSGGQCQTFQALDNCKPELDAASRRELPKRFVYCLRSRKLCSDIGIKQHNVRTFSVTLSVLPSHSARKVVLWKHLIFFVRIRIVAVHDV
jgi:hypothetical protein